MKSKHIVIIGAGLAGLSCGVELSEDHQVTILEAKPVVGGRTSSWVEDGMYVESGLHRFLGYYDALPKILRKVGVELDDILTWEEQIEVRVKGKRSLVYGLAPIFGPWKLIHSMIGNNHVLHLKDKLSLIPFFLNGFKDYIYNPRELDRFSILTYAKKHGVSEKGLTFVVTPLSTGIYFLPPEKYSAYVFFGLLAPALTKFYKMRVGIFLGGMTEMMCEPMVQYVNRNYGSVQTSTSVDHLALEDGKVTGVYVGNHFIEADHVVIATQLVGAKKILRKHFEDHHWFQPMFQLPTMHASTIQIDLDFPAMSKDVTVFGPETHLCSFAEQSRTTFRHSHGRLSIILSPPEEFLHLRPDEILEMVYQDCEKIGIPIRGHVLDYRIISHPNEFHSLAFGHDHLRPDPKTPIQGLTLAGDYTRQPYFSTMEGAVVSGLNAAEIVKNCIDH